MDHFYPKDFADYLLRHWHIKQTRLRWPVSSFRGDAVQNAGGCPPPEREVLENVLSCCYLASLLREENRPLKFRLILCEPEMFPADGSPPEGFHRLEFAEPRPCTVRELHKLAPAIDFYRSLIGVRQGRDGEPEIWGVVHSGPRWIQIVHGGRATAARLPCAPVIGVTRPGRIAVGDGRAVIATLNQGRISVPVDAFDTRWIREGFQETQAALLAAHQAARTGADKPWASLDPDFVRVLAQQFVRRVISSIRSAHLGGTLIYLPHDKAEAYLAENRFLNIKYRFVEEEPRRRFQTLMVNILNTLAEAYARCQVPDQGVGWAEYAALNNERIERLDEALYELAHFIAGLANVDGAVVMTKQMEILGFGAEISGNLPEVRTVASAVDPEGENIVIESTDGVGTRHRSAYRLCHALHDVIAVVISHDGNIRYMGWKDGMVTLWDQVATSVLDF